MAGWLAKHLSLNRHIGLHETRAAMLRYFPASFPDETLYSRLCRFHRISGYNSDRQSLRELIGLHTHVVVSTLPSKLGTLVSRLPAQSNVSVEDIVSNNTLLAYFTTFMPEYMATSVRAAMCGESASGIKMSIGLMASRLGGSNQLRFCRICAQEEYVTTGQPYWHRTHQLPGVWVCTVHKQTLCVLDAETTQLKRQRLFLPDDPDFIGIPDPIEMPRIQQETALRIAQMSADVLHGQAQIKGIDDIHRRHRSNAVTYGLLRPNGRIRVEDLEKAVGHYCNGMPTNVEFSVVRARLFDWSLKLLRKPRGTVIHPMVHIILMDCLRSIQEWPLLSCASLVPAAEVSTSSPQCKIIDCSELIKIMRSPSVTLSSAARQMGISVTTAGIIAERGGIKVLRRPKHITEERVRDVKTSLKLGLSIEDVALKHAISIVSVYRILRMDMSLVAEYKEKLFSSTREQYRQRFIDVRTDKTAYSWLRRHDLPWLTKHLAICPKAGARKSCVDWCQRDEALALQIVAIETQLREMPGKPTFISVTRLKRLTSMADTIDRSLPKLPLTATALKTCTESAPTHQRRRILWAYLELKKRPDFLYRQWKVLRLAGVRKLFPSNEALVASLI